MLLKLVLMPEPLVVTLLHWTKETWRSVRPRRVFLLHVAEPFGAGHGNGGMWTVCPLAEFGLLGWLDSSGREDPGPGRPPGLGLFGGLVRDRHRGCFLGELEILRDDVRMGVRPGDSSVW